MISHASLQGCRQYITLRLHGDLNVRRGKQVFVLFVFSSPFFFSFFPPKPYSFRTQRGLQRQKLAAGSSGFRVWLVSGNLIRIWVERCLHGPHAKICPGIPPIHTTFPVRPRQPAGRPRACPWASQGDQSGGRPEQR